MFDTLLILCGILLIAYLLVFYFLFKGIKKLNYTRSEHQPSVSIIVSMHDEQENAEQILDHLCNQNYPLEKLEIIVVNDRSKDNTANILAQNKQQFAHLKIITISDLIRGFAPKKRAIDTAVRQANGEIILLTDADGRPGNNWVSTMVSYFSEKTGMVIGYAPYTCNKFSEKLLALEYFSHAAIAAATTGLKYPLTCVGTNIAYRKEVFLDLDGFGEFKNIHTGDDDLFLQRVREKSDWEIRYAIDKKTYVFNNPPDSWKKFYHQRLRYASKGFVYPVKVTLALVGYYLFNLLLLVTGILGLIMLNFPLTFFGIIVAKFIIDFILVKKSGTVLNESRLLTLFPIAFILHIPYVVYFGLMGNLQKFEWSGVKQ